MRMHTVSGSSVLSEIGRCCNFQPGRAEGIVLLHPIDAKGLVTAKFGKSKSASNFPRRLAYSIQPLDMERLGFSDKGLLDILPPSSQLQMQSSTHEEYTLFHHT